MRQPADALLLSIALVAGCLISITAASGCTGEQCPADLNMKPHLQLMIPGPIEFHEDVLAAAGGLAVSHVDMSFVKEFGESLELLRKVFLTKTAQPFIISGSGTLGWDIVASNLVEPGEHVLVLNTGYFGDRFADSLEAYGAKVQHIRAKEVGGVPELKDIEAALKAGPVFKAVTITHVDTSTGVLMDVKAIASLVSGLSPNTLIVIDGVCSAGGEDLKFDEWGIDVVLTASQKALGTPPGLSIFLASERAMKVLDERKVPVSNYYASLRKWLPIMKAYEEQRPAYFATPAVQLVQALRVSLKQILGDTPDVNDRFAKHVAVSERIKDEVGSWGLKLVPTSRQHAAHTMTAVYLPDGMTLPEVLPKVMARGVFIAGGLHAEIGTKYFRIGHMGISVMDDARQHIDNVLKVVKEALGEAGYAFPKAVAAA